MEKALKRLKIETYIYVTIMCIVCLGSPLYFETDAIPAKAEGVLTQKELRKESPGARGSAGKYYYHLILKINGADKDFIVYDDNMQDSINIYDYLLKLGKPIEVVYNSNSKIYPVDQVYSIFYEGQNIEIDIIPPKGWFWLPMSFTLIVNLLILPWGYNKRKRKIFEKETARGV